MDNEDKIIQEKIREEVEIMASEAEKAEAKKLRSIIQVYQQSNLVNMFNSFQLQLPVQETLTPALKEFLGILSAIESDVPVWPMISAIQQFSTYIARYTAEYPLSTFSEERKLALIESYRQWGKCGWSWIGNTPIKFYSKPPIDIADANIRIKPYHNAEIVEELFLGLRSKAVRQGDLESAIFCYKSRQYKPCALVLFGMIDAKLIKKQSPTQNRLVGKRAIKKLYAQFDKTHDQRWLYTMLRYVNLFACLETMFEGGENFKSEPPVINRNYIDHGMERRRVRQRDCIQLFFVLDNLIDFFNDNV